MTWFTSFNNLLGLGSVFFKFFLEFFLFLLFDIDLLICFFFHFYHFTLTYYFYFFIFIIWHWLIALWALWFVQFFFCGAILILYPASQVGRVNIGWLDFFRLIFYLVLYFAIKLLTLKHCHCFHLSLCGVIPGAR